jgi:hypothetical protein
MAKISALDGALKRKNVAVLAFKCGEFVSRYRLVTGEKPTSQNGHVSGQDYENEVSDNLLLIFERSNEIWMEFFRNVLRNYSV